MLEEVQNTRGVTCRQRNAFMAGNDLFGCRQGAPHHETREVQPFISRRGRENPLLFARGAELDAVVTCGCWCGHDRFSNDQHSVRTLYGQDALAVASGGGFLTRSAIDSAPSTSVPVAYAWCVTAGVRFGILTPC